MNLQSSTVRDEPSSSVRESAPPLPDDDEQLSKRQRCIDRLLPSPSDASRTPPLLPALVHEHEVKLFPQRSPVFNEVVNAKTAPLPAVHAMESKLVVLTVHVAEVEAAQLVAMSGYEEVIFSKVVC